MTMLTLEIQGILHNEWVRLKGTDPNLSLRGFAKILDLPVSSLSEILNGKRPASPKLAAAISSKLTLDEQTAIRLKDLALAERESRKNQVNPNGFLQTAKALTVDQFSLVADWYHFAICQLTLLDDFQSDFSWIARRLNLTEEVVQGAIERLTRLELLTSEGGIFKLTMKEVKTVDNISNLAIRKGNTQLLRKAQTSLEMDPVDVRDVTTLTLPVDMSKMGEARKLIRKFHDEFSELMNKGEKKEVYCLGVQFFPLTEREVGEA
ncbi:MAG: TIGR02147 family protein, partial [Pseudobdellovibrionaceae bacterium]